MRQLASFPRHQLRCICFISIVLGINLVTGIHFADEKQASFIKNLDQYQISIPTRVTRSGNHISNVVSPHRDKRSVDGGRHGDDIHYKINIDDTDILLQLQPNRKFISPTLLIERRTNSYKNVTDSVFKRYEDSSTCHYTGQIVGDDSSKVALEICSGLRGLVHRNQVAYFIEPVLGLADTSQGHPHIVYNSSLPWKSQNTHSTQERSSCDAKDNQDEIQREKWEQHQQSRGPRRKRRSISVEHNVEALVVVDPLMMDYYKNEDVTNYVLTIMNMVVSLFHDASLGNAMNIVLVRLILLEEHQNNLVITHHADKSLRSFCKWQASMNFKDDDHPNHHDVAILLTKKDICSRMNEPCSTLGLSMMSGMCQPHRSCNINEDTGLALAFTIAHELGHNFGMKHDGIHNDCELKDENEFMYVMSSHLLVASPSMKWSPCSKKEITKFVDRGWGFCLNDAPGDLGDDSFNYPLLPPGTMYDADHQCRLMYGPEAALCDGMKQEDICNTLWCRVNNRCSTRLEAAAEGTICGNNKWCFSGKCVEIGERPESINGNWGEWSSWSECTRTCGGGVSIVERHCDNPMPSNGGKFCIGERRRYRICNTEDCPENVPSFRHVQCEEFNYIPYKSALYEWEAVPTPNTPCQLHCKPKDKFFSVMLRDTVVDGTPCTTGTKNMCISGKCMHVGCDYVINSNAREDHCGVCRGDGSTCETIKDQYNETQGLGDGSTCETIKDQYNETQGLGYVEATVIPKNARNILVEEVAEANNYLALQNDKGEYYLNGNWFIQWSGDYEIAGTTITYERHRNKEMFKAAGPLKEPLHIMLLLQGRNPGVRFEYTVPKQNSSDHKRPEFTWQYQDWTHCTSSCGGGTQRSEVVCVEKEAGIVDDIYCNSTSNPDDKQRVCNAHLCPARWWAGPWQHCSVTCGNDGIHRRTVICVRSLGQDEQIALEDSKCDYLEKPSEAERCRDKVPCPGSSEWVTTEWSSCAGNVCGIKSREVTCKDPEIGCDPSTMPDTYTSCSNITCGYWDAGEWGKCTRECDGGVRYRKVSCIGSEICDLDLQPPNQEPCNNHICPTTTTVTTTTMKATTAKSTVTIVDTTTEAANEMFDFFDISELTDNNGNEKSDDSGTIINNVKNDLEESDSNLFSEKDTPLVEEISLGGGKTVKIHEGGFDNDKERNMGNIFTEMKISGPDNMLSHSIESVTENSTEEDNSAVAVPRELSLAEDDNGSMMETDGRNLTDADVVELGNHGIADRESNHKDLQEDKLKVRNDSEIVQIVSIEEGGQKHTNKSIIIPQVEEEQAVGIEDQSQTGNDKQHHRPDGFNKIGEVKEIKEKVDIKEIGPGRLPGGQGRPLPDLLDVDDLLGNVHLPGGEDPAQGHNLEWTVGGWTECSRLCGYGVQTRSVGCVNMTSHKDLVEENCDILTKPSAIKSCMIERCRDWRTTPWSQCSSTCGYAVQKRTVNCPDKHQCDPDQRPADVQKCQVPACLSWIHGQWSQCSQTCGGGQQIRVVECVNMTSQRIAVGCPELLKPDESKDCNRDKCPHQELELNKHSCDGNIMSYKVCRALRRMGHCNKMFVKVKCCKTCEERSLLQNRPKGDLER